jgi:hypothetical protein
MPHTVSKATHKYIAHCAGVGIGFLAHEQELFIDRFQAQHTRQYIILESFAAMDIHNLTKLAFVRHRLVQFVLLVYSTNNSLFIQSRVQSRLQE